jgi:hypothetical protein
MGEIIYAVNADIEVVENILFDNFITPLDIYQINRYPFELVVHIDPKDDAEFKRVLHDNYIGFEWV